MYALIIIFLIPYALGGPLDQNQTTTKGAICYVGDKQLSPGQRTRFGNFVYECSLTSDNWVHTKIVGCLSDEKGDDREYSIGERWDGGQRPYRYVYECVKGQTLTVRRAVQCLYDSADGQARIDPGTDQRVGQTTVRCERLGENGVQFKLTRDSSKDTGTAGTANSNTVQRDANPQSAPPASSPSKTLTCNVDGQELTVGQRGKSGHFVYECQQIDNLIRTSIVACVWDDGREHPLNERWETGKSPFKYIMECSKSGSLTSIKIAQCFYDSDEGQAKLDAGQEQKIGNATIRCDRIGDEVQYHISYAPSDVKSSGSGSTGSGSTSTNTQPQSEKGPRCYLDGQEMTKGQRTKSGDFVYECRDRAEIVACIDDKGNEHAVNERWESGDARPFKYIFECSKRGDRTWRRVAQCFYDSQDGQAKLDPGSQQRIGNATVRCEKMGEHGVQYNISYE